MVNVFVLKFQQINIKNCTRLLCNIYTVLKLMRIQPVVFGSVFDIYCL
jgi:hypothetical protein